MEDNKILWVIHFVKFLTQGDFGEDGQVVLLFPLLVLGHHLREHISHKSLKNHRASMKGKSWAKCREWHWVLALPFPYKAKSLHFSELYYSIISWDWWCLSPTVIKASDKKGRRSWQQTLELEPYTGLCSIIQSLSVNTEPSKMHLTRLLENWSDESMSNTYHGLGAQYKSHRHDMKALWRPTAALQGLPLDSK